MPNVKDTANLEVGCTPEPTSRSSRQKSTVGGLDPPDPKVCRCSKTPRSVKHPVKMPNLGVGYTLIDKIKTKPGGEPPTPKPTSRSSRRKPTVGGLDPPDQKVRWCNKTTQANISVHAMLRFLF